MLLMTRRPSFSTPVMASKLESNKTKSAIELAASAPEAIAMLQSLWRNAKTSLTPSPVIATVCPKA